MDKRLALPVVTIENMSDGLLLCGSRSGVTGYEARQTTANFGPAITSALAADHYAINSIGWPHKSLFQRRD